MTAKQKAGYVLNEWMIGWFLLYLMVVFVMVLMMNDAAADYAVRALVFLAVTAVMIGPFAITKWLRISRSKQRTADTCSGGLG